MEGLIAPVVALLQIGLARGVAAAARITVMAACGALAVIAALCAIGCAVAALWIAVLPSLGPAGAALAAAGALLLLSAAKSLTIFSRSADGAASA
jgi:hypothetical protein